MILTIKQHNRERKRNKNNAPLVTKMRIALTSMQTTDDKVVCVGIKSVNLFSALDTDGNFAKFEAHINKKKTF